MLSLMSRLAAIWAVLGGMALLLIVAVTMVNVGAFGLDKLVRLFGETVAGLPGYEDFVSLVIGAATPMLLPYAQVHRAHLGVDVLTSHLSDGANVWIDRITLALIALVAFFLAYWMVIGMFETRADGALSRVIGWPVWPFYLPGIASLVLWGGVALAQLLEDPTGIGTPNDNAVDENEVHRHG